MRTSSRLLTTVTLCLTLAACHGDERAARASAQAWLPALDSGDYAQSWTVAAPYLQLAVPQTAWNASMSRMRATLVKLMSRSVRLSTATTCALNDPCVVVETDASFEHKPAAVETITVMPAADGHWKVAGYFIQ